MSICACAVLLSVFAEADLERVLVIDDRDTPLTLADERIARAIRENNARVSIPGKGFRLVQAAARRMAK